jgi:hypothetical protein
VVGHGPLRRGGAGRAVLGRDRDLLALRAATRDRLAERNLSDPAVFAIFGATQAAPDDAEVWPETGVARLACTMTWNDTRRVAILPEAPARAALDGAVREWSRGAATGRYLGEDWRDRPARFGPDRATS